MHIKLSHFKHHQTKKSSLIRYIVALLVLLTYSVFMIFRFGIDGIGISVLSWSALVMATPIADGGVIVDFPMRLLLGIRMVYSEVLVWVIAILINISYLSINPSIYEKTNLTKIFYKILTTPWPLWTIILISFMGTFISVYFADELLDVIKHNERIKYTKYKLVFKTMLLVFVVVFVYLGYKYFLKIFGINF